jgi:hypothetical protein
MKADISTLHKPDILTLQRHTWNDACVTRGATVGYDLHAREAALQAVTHFLSAHWNLHS